MSIKLPYRGELDVAMMVRWTVHMLLLLAMFFAYSDESNGQANIRKPQVGGGPAIPNEGYLVEEIRDGLYWLSDGAYNTMFLVTSDGVIAADAPPTLGANYLKAIAEVTQQPIKYLVYSHEHTDHIGFDCDTCDTKTHLKADSQKAA